MATARQLARLVSLVGTVSSGAVRTYLGRTQTTREGLGIVPKLMRLVSESISVGSSADAEATHDVAAFLYRLVLRYGTMRRAMEAIAAGQRRHPRISLDKAGAWGQAMAGTAGSIDATIRRHQWLRVHLSKWYGGQGPGLEDELALFEGWMHGPLPGSDDEHEFPLLADAGSDAPRRGAETPSPDAVATGGHLLGEDAPEGVTEPGADTDDTRAVQRMLAAMKRPRGTFGERVCDPPDCAALERLRTSTQAHSRAVAAVADRDLAAARMCVRMLDGAEDSAGTLTLRGDLLYIEDECDEAIVVYRAAVDAASGAEEQSWCMVNLAMALMGAHRGSTVDRAREARELLARVASVRSDGSAPWAIAQLQRGLAEMCPPQIDRAESMKMAISSLGSAGRVFAAERGPGWWAETMYWLGCAWVELPSGDRRESVERAIARFNDALSALSRTEHAERWAQVHVDMGIAWERMPSGNRSEALEYAIGCFTSALSVRKKNHDPVGWARIQNNLGNLWVQFPAGNQRQNIERAIAHQQAALEVWSGEDRRLDWATTQNNLGNAYALLPAEGAEREKNLRRAIACYKSALEVRTRATHPLEWATTQNNLGSALLHLPTGGRAPNIKEAISCYEQALEVRTRERFPLEWAKTQANLGNAWAKDPTGFKGDNLAEAIAYYEAALEEFKRERFPRQHAVISQRLRDTQGQLRQMSRPI